jgi:cellulose synthase/poly-beta-1,6-N-acetylglucosamine synthase-like glycosyltransferase
MKKVLCFTPSHKRLKMLRSCVLDIQNQSYENIFHSINITLGITETNKKNNYEIVYDDLKTEKNLFSFSKNQHQHYNHILAITNVPDYESYDIFVKIDDDDIYKKDYVKTIVEFFNQNNVDVVSSKMKYQLNGNLIRIGTYDNLGANPENCDFKIPATFAFNLKALKLIQNINKIYGFEDNMWRDAWCGKCNIFEINNTENIVWHIHGKNTSTADFLIKQ